MSTKTLSLIPTRCLYALTQIAARSAARGAFRSARSFGLVACIGLATWAPDLAAAAEVCGQMPSAFERVDPGDDESGIGGTGHSPEPRTSAPPRVTFSARGDDESGIGGTGRAPRSDGGDESGIGGTGVFGTVLRTDRLCVNGFEILVPDTLQIEAATGGQSPSSLSVGQIVFVRALRTDAGLLATRIELQADLQGTPWKTGPPLDLLSIEGFVSEGPEGPRLAGHPLDFSAAGLRPEARDLRPGTRVRAIGRLDDGRVLRITQPTRPARPPALDRAPAPGSGSPLPETLPPSRPPVSPRPGDPRPAKDQRTVRPERPTPELRPETPERPERPERPESRPDFERPERPALDERPQPRVIERPDVLERAIQR